jgi:hypothetical protein
MNRTQLLVVLWSAASISSAQTWCPPDAQWWYRYDNISGGTGYVHVAYVNDTVIGGIPAQELSAHVVGYDQFNQVPFDHFWPPVYTAVIDDVVSVWTPNGFDTLFHYNAVPGDGWYSPNSTWMYNWFSITDTGTYVIDGVPLRWWSFDLGVFNEYADTIVDRMGALNLFVNPGMVLSVTDPEVHELRCYQDQDIEYSTGTAPSCEYVLGIPDELAGRPGMRLWPNPGTAELNVDPGCDRCAFKLTVRDATGRSWHQLSTAMGPLQIDLHELPVGVYAVEVVDVNGHRQVRRWVKG